MEDQRCRLVKCLDAERVFAGLMEVVKIKKQNRKQHQHRAEQCIEKKLDRGVELARPTPDSDQQVHGNQHGFPEDEEQEEIKCHEDAQHACLQHQKPDVVFLHAVLNRSP